MHTRRVDRWPTSCDSKTNGHAPRQWPFTPEKLGPDEADDVTGLAVTLSRSVLEWVLPAGSPLDREHVDWGICNECAKIRRHNANYLSRALKGSWCPHICAMCPPLTGRRSNNANHPNSLRTHLHSWDLQHWFRPGLGQPLEEQWPRKEVTLSLRRDLLMCEDGLRAQRPYRPRSSLTLLSQLRGRESLCSPQERSALERHFSTEDSGTGPSLPVGAACLTHPSPLSSLGQVRHQVQLQGTHQESWNKPRLSREELRQW